MLAAKRAGSSFDRVITLGHQKLHLHPPEIRALCDEFGLPTGRDRPAWAGTRFADYSDDFFEACLGTIELAVLDYSDYEGATLIHDLNQPVPEAWHQCFDAVIDGGTLEHVFDVREALANVMRLTAVGGRVFLSSPANNLCGHGLYQFSPELMFRVFAPAHGFRAERVELAEARYPNVSLVPMGVGHRVRDPDEAGQRVGLVTKRPVVMSVVATKVEHKQDPFESPPQQSDYTKRWGDSVEGSRVWRIAKNAYPRLPSRLQMLAMHILGMRQRRRYSLANRGAYTPQD
jgi:hypothetical protein